MRKHTKKKYKYINHKTTKKYIYINHLYNILTNALFCVIYIYYTHTHILEWYKIREH